MRPRPPTTPSPSRRRPRPTGPAPPTPGRTAPNRTPSTQALIRERATGRAEALETEVEVLRDERRTLDGELAAAREREAATERTANALRTELGHLRAELEHARGQARVQAEHLTKRLEAIEGDSGARSVPSTPRPNGPTREAFAAETLRTAELDRRLARAEGEREAALARGDEAARRAERAEAERLDDARRAERALGELAAARREDLARSQARIDQLAAALAEAELRVPDPVVPLPSTEFQPSLFFDDGLEQGGDSSTPTAGGNVPGRGAPSAPKEPGLMPRQADGL